MVMNVSPTVSGFFCCVDVSRWLGLYERLLGAAQFCSTRGVAGARYDKTAPMGSKDLLCHENIE